MLTIRRHTGLLLILACISLAACRQETPTESPTVPPPNPETTATDTLIPPIPTATRLPTGEPTEEPGIPTEIRDARDAVLAFLVQQMGTEAPPMGLEWAEERTTPEGLVGAETFRFEGDHWVVTVSYPVTSPDQVKYQVVVMNTATAFLWQGEVSASGDVTEHGSRTDDPVMAARESALTFLRAQYADIAPPEGLSWTRRRMTPEGIVGAETFQYRAGFWIVTISYPVVAPDMVVYRVLVSNENSGFQWQGEVDAQGQVTETAPPIAGQPVVGWYGQVRDLPGGAEFDDYLTLLPEGTGEFGIGSTDPAIESQLEELRQSANSAHFWGTLVCEVPDYSGCQLAVTRVRADLAGPTPEPDPVERWQGRVASTSEGAQFDDYFILQGAYPVRFGITSAEPAIASQLEGLRDVDTSIGIWGRLTCGVVDVNGSQIEVIAIEVIGRPAVPASERAEDWSGTIVRLPVGGQYDDYFEREDGERFGIDSIDPDMQKRIQALGIVGARVRVWGRVVINVPDVEGRQIQLERFELEQRYEIVDGWLGTIVALEPGAEFDDAFEREDGQSFGIDTLDPKLAKRLEDFRSSGERVRVWGVLITDAPDVQGRQIRVEEIEPAG
jgi:hypothetical protein